MNKGITYKITFNQSENKATFTDTRRKKPLYIGGTEPGELAEMYRYIACYFLQMAHYEDYPNTWTTPKYYSGDEWEQIHRMLSRCMYTLLQRIYRSSERNIIFPVFTLTHCAIQWQQSALLTVLISSAYQRSSDTLIQQSRLTFTVTLTKKHRNGQMKY